MAWTTLLTSTLLPGEPLTSAKGLAFYENPIAIADGDASAPKVQGQALGNVALAWQENSGTTESSITGVFTRLDLLVMEIELQYLGASSGIAAVQIALSDDGGTTWGSWINLHASDSQSAGDPAITTVSRVSISDAEVIYRDHTADVGSALTTSAITVPAGEVDAIKFRASQAAWGYLVRPFVLGGAA